MNPDQDLGHLKNNLFGYWKHWRLIIIRFG